MDLQATQQGDDGRATTLVVIETPFSASNPWTFVRNIQYMILCNFFANKVYGCTWVPQMCNTQFALFGVSGFVGDTLGAMLLPFTPAAYAAFDLDRDATLARTDEVRRSAKIDKAVVFRDFGVSRGMSSGLQAVRDAGKVVEYATLPPELKRHIIGESIPSTLVPLALTSSVVGPWAFGMWRLARMVMTRGRR